MLYQIDQVANNARHAGSKARNDATAILGDMGFKSLRLNCSLNESPMAIAKDIVSMDLQMRKLFKSMEPNSVAVVQFPYRCFMTSTGKVIRSLADSKSIKCVALVHDIDSLRRENAESRVGQYSLSEKLHCDCLFLRYFDFVISHNAKMSEFLAKSGVSPNRIINLELFDYLTEPPCRDQSQLSKNVSVAGNLTEKKAGYLYSLPKELKGSSLHFDLFGNGYSCESSEDISYRGSVDPAELPALLPSGFGLVWDGPSADCCAGAYGNYLKFNNPHKLSLYYASGLIPVVWERSAAAGFVRSTDSGITVSRIKDLPQAINSLSPEEYKALVGNAAEIGNKVRTGFYLRRATGEVLSQM